MTFVLSSHILPEVEPCCDRLLIINQDVSLPKALQNHYAKSTFLLRFSEVKVRGDIEELTKVLREIDSEMEVSALLEKDKEGFHDISVKTLDRSITGEQLLTAILKRDSWRVREITEVKPASRKSFLLPQNAVGRKPSVANRYILTLRDLPRVNTTRMRGFLAIARHEVFVLLISPATYVAGFLFLLMMWLVYWLILKDLPSEDLPASSFFQLFWLPVLFMVPLLTMRTLAEERRMGTRKYLNYPNHTSSYRCREVFWSLPGISRILGSGTGLSNLDCFTSP